MQDFEQQRSSSHKGTFSAGSNDEADEGDGRKDDNNASR